MSYERSSLAARKKVLEMVHKAGTSHIGSNFSCIDILTVLFDKMDFDGDFGPDRDRFVLSKGWAAASLYYFLAEKGILPKEDLETFCQQGSEYIGLAEPTVRGVEIAGGSMGLGLPGAIGLALGQKMLGSKRRTFVVASDGEMDCGTTWESALIANQFKLDNLTLFVDANGFQAMGKKSEVLDIEPLEDKFRAFGWDAMEIDGHNFKQIELAVKTLSSRPKVFIARTTKGKGVGFMENDNLWHYWHVDEEIYKKAHAELCQT